METPVDIDEVIERWDVPEEVRLALVFTGMVQGVGFRWTTQALARQSGVAGWVKNEGDGTVSCELQGTGHAVCDVLRGLRDQYANARSKYEMLRRLGLGFSVASCERRVCRETGDVPQFEVRV